MLLAAVAVAVVAAVGVATWLAIDDGADDATTSPAATGMVPGLERVVDGFAEVGTTAPDFALPGLEGGTVRLSDYRGAPVVLNFWASWCAPCRAEFPLLRKAAAAADGRYTVLGVSTRDIRGDARAFAKQARANWPNAFDADESVRKAYGVQGQPQTLFIDANGTIVERIPRELSRTDLDRGIEQATDAGR